MAAAGAVCPFRSSRYAPSASRSASFFPAPDLFPRQGSRPPPSTFLSQPESPSNSTVHAPDTYPPLGSAGRLLVDLVPAKQTLDALRPRLLAADDPLPQVPELDYRRANVRR